MVTKKDIPFRDMHTWVKITEPDQLIAGALPIIVLHGGPGMSHNYVKNISGLAEETGRTVIHYDQVGCGRSTHLPDAPGDFWTPELFVEEFHNLVLHLGISEYHLLGQSWGGMLAAEITVRRPAGLQSLIICNSPASMPLWLEGANDLRAALPTFVSSALSSHEADGTTDDPEYLQAVDIFYSKHVCRMTPLPPDFQESVDQMEAEPTVYFTMNGPNEFSVIGTLREWSIIDRLSQIEVPTLVVAGEFDEATPKTWQPFLENIPDVTSHVFPDASHCVHLEHPTEFRHVIGSFIQRFDSPLTTPRTAPTAQE
jgi:L-proline amide hydrolase